MNRDDLERVCLSYLTAGRHKEAVEAVCEFEARQNNPSGLNMNWAAPATRERFVRTVASIFTIKPTILGDLTDREWSLIRVRAAMLHLTGNSRAPSRWGIEGVSVGNMKADATARMVLFPATDLDKFERWAEIRVTHAKIKPAPDACAHCQSFAEMVFKTDSAPELPHPACDHEMGCRCQFSPVFDEEL